MTEVKAYASSISIGGYVVYPISNPKEIAERLQEIIYYIEERAFRAGEESIKNKMREALGIKTQ